MDQVRIKLTGLNDVFSLNDRNSSGFSHVRIIVSGGLAKNHISHVVRFPRMNKSKIQM